MVYLDYAANSPVDSEVLDYYYDVTKKYYANPNSSHYLGLEAKKMIDDASIHIASILGVLPEEVIYTSGATESNNMAIKGVCERYKNYGKHIIVSGLEHNSIIASATTMQEAGFEVDVLNVTKDGIVDLDNLKKLLREDTILVSICSVDSELGIRQPIEEIANIVHSMPHAVFHTDAAQAIGKVKVDFSNVDLVTIAPHKFYGLNGFGVLIKKKNISIKPLIHGGKSTTVYRSGTPVLGSILAFEKALEIATQKQEERYEIVTHYNEMVRDFLKGYSNVFINSTDLSIPYTLNFSIRGVKSDVFAKKLEEHAVILSTKTSCCPVGTPSKLVFALTHDKALASSSLRVSFSHLTTEEEINEFFKVFDLCIKEVS